MHAWHACMCEKRSLAQNPELGHVHVKMHGGLSVSEVGRADTASI